MTCEHGHITPPECLACVVKENERLRKQLRYEYRLAAWLTIIFGIAAYVLLWSFDFRLAMTLGCGVCSKISYNTFNALSEKLEDAADSKSPESAP